MTESAARLVDGGLPRVPVRQWVLSLPHRLRYLLAWDHVPVPFSPVLEDLTVPSEKTVFEAAKALCGKA